MQEFPTRKEYIEVKGRKIYSVIHGNGFPVIFLLGWLNDGDRFAFKSYTSALKEQRKKYSFHFVHLSNFYKSSYSPFSLTLSDYIEELHLYLKTLNIRQCYLIGHSAGGRIALGYTLTHPSQVKKLVLLNSAGLNSSKPPVRQKQFAHISFSKFWVLPAHRKILQQTYENLFVTSLKADLPRIKTATLIIWGRKDRVLPVSHAYTFHKLLPHSTVTILGKTGHMTVKNPKTYGYIFTFFENTSVKLRRKRLLSKEIPVPFMADVLSNKALREYREKYLKLADGKTYREFFTISLPANEKSQFDTDAINTLKALSLFAEYVIWKQPSLLQELQLPSVDVEGIKRRGTKHLFNYSRIDTIFDGEQFRFIEVNARRPQMFEDADWFSLAFGSSEKKTPTQQNAKDIADSILSMCTANIGKKPKEIFLISDNPKWDYPYSLANQLHNAVKSAEIIDVHSDTPHYSCTTYTQFLKGISLKQSKLYYQDKMVDLIVLQNLCGGTSLFYTKGGIRDERVREAYLAGTLEVASPPSALIIGSKLSIAFITDPAMQKILGFSESIVKSLKRFPETRLARPHDSASLSEDTVLKSTKSVSGGGVLMNKSTKNELDTDHFKYFVTQKRVPYQTREIWTWIDREKHEAGVTVEPFVVNIPSKSEQPFVSGYSARAIRKEHLPKISKFNPADTVPEILFGCVNET